MKIIKKMFLGLVAVLMVLLSLETPIYAGFDIGKQGKGVFIFNIVVVLLVVAVGGYIWWKKHQDEEEE